jgi:hypothetical protein
VTGSCQAARGGLEHTIYMRDRLIRPKQFSRADTEKRMDELARRYHETHDRR